MDDAKVLLEEIIKFLSDDYDEAHVRAMVLDSKITIEIKHNDTVEHVLKIESKPKKVYREKKEQ